MDTIVHAAIDEICSNGVNGLPLSLLWRRLHEPLSSNGLSPCPALKRAVLLGLSAVPGIHFKYSDGSEFDQKSNPFEECESLELKVFADEQLRRCFVGLYDVKSSNITPPQQRVLELLALARGTGVTQHQLCKELGMPANNFFYVVKRLESWGLIVRHSTIVRTKERASDKDPKSSQPVHTNLIHLHRYATPLSSQQQLEITKESNNLEENHGDSVTGSDDILDECGQDDVRVKDFLPALKAVCDRLEQAAGKVLVVSDIKRELGYRESHGHKAWRKVSDRLENAGLVEIFEANVSSEVETPTKLKKRKSSGQKKPVKCLKLLRKFSLKLFEHRTTDCEYDNLASDQHIASGIQVQNTDLLVELPLEQQFVDMIDAEGSKGLLGVEVCKRLGINKKMFETLSHTIVPRFGLHQLSENRKRGSAYRFWTPRNFCPQLPNSSFIRLEHSPTEVQVTLSPAEDPSQGENSKRTTLADYLNSQSWLTGENPEKGVADEELNHGLGEGRGFSENVMWAAGSDNVADDMSITFPHEVNGAQSNSLVEAPPSPVPKPFNLQQGQIYPSLTSATRELRILEVLETEKIMIKPELQRWLASCEKDKRTKIDRKTLGRYLTKLKHEGHCKVMEFNIPGVSNCGRHREIRVVLHPSVKGSASELSEQVHEKLRIFEIQQRSTVSQPKREFPVPVLHGIERIHKNSSSDAQNIKLEAMRANGFVLGKMVRTKLLHCFLWDYVNNLSRCIDVPTSIKYVNGPSNQHGSCLLFSLDTAIKAMPLELYLQVVGSALKWKDMIEKCKNGLLLFDLPDEEYTSLMETQAVSRLSRLTDILRRLKLIRLVADENLKDAVKSSHTTLVYALDLKPYIEEPPSVDPLPGCSGSVDLRPHFRHDFVLSTTEALEKYWNTLENCYAAADPKAAVHAFPGSVAYEALRVYYDNRQHRCKRFHGDLDVQVTGSNTRNDRSRSQRKRKRLSEGSFAKNVMVNPTDSLEAGEDEQEQESSIEHCIMPMLKQARRSKFSWTEKADRQLIILYARQKAIQGAQCGTDWASISDLPAAPTICRRRLASLGTNDKFRKSLMRLCNLLTQRYAQYLDRERNLMLYDNRKELDSPGKHWDDFEDCKIKAALHEVLMIKKMMKLDPSKRTGSAFQGPHEPTASTPCKSENDSEKEQTSSIITGRVHQSLAVSSAVELFKLYFLTSSRSENMPELLAETLRRYSQHDLYSAFDYLMEKKILMGSDTSIFLSQSFLRSLSLSQFPTNTGKRAARLTSWIHENEKKLMEGVVNLPSDLQCGDIYQLMALASSGEVSISPILPHEGVGEAEDSRSSKRKYDDPEYDDFVMSKKHRCHSLQESEIFSRREKGFPGITVSLSRTTILRSNVVEFFKDDDQTFLLSENDHFYATLGQKSNCIKSPIYHFKEAPDFGSIMPATIIPGDSIWEVMVNCITQNLSNRSDWEKCLVDPELIKSTYINIQKAGDQGLSMSEVSECIGIKGKIVSEHVVDVLVLFGFVLKVNGYNDVHAVDGLYRAKYFLGSMPTSSRDPEPTLSSIPQKVDDATNLVSEGINHEHEGNFANVDDVHTVTILNLKGCSESSTASIGESNKSRNFDVTTAFHPILPWINRDGTINGTVYRGLTRRVLSIVTQNPGVLEDGILRQMNVLNPQSCRKLLELMVLDKHLCLRKMSQRTSPATPPALLESLISNQFKKPTYVCREHYFANFMSTVLL